MANNVAVVFIGMVQVEIHGFMVLGILEFEEPAHPCQKGDTLPLALATELLLPLECAATIRLFATKNIMLNIQEG